MIVCKIESHNSIRGLPVLGPSFCLWLITSDESNNLLGKMGSATLISHIALMNYSLTNKTLQPAE